MDIHPQIVRDIRLCLGSALCSLAGSMGQQIYAQLVAQDYWNYGITAMLGVSGLVIVISTWNSQTQPTEKLPLVEQTQVLAALDLLFQHFSQEPESRDIIRQAALAVTSHRYRERVNADKSH